uniref:C-type lectin domain-containing protein n=1 Tax=Meloidogyne javanica TaxID=6303 RepID=A0A915N5I7_MELJA
MEKLKLKRGKTNLEIIKLENGEDIEGELSLLEAPPINEKSKGNLDNNEKNRIKNVLDWNKQRAPVICGDEEWHYFDGFCYKLINGKFTWEEALGECKKQNSNLVSIQSEQENDFVGSLSTKFDQNFDNFCHGFWIGMTRKYIEETDSFKSEWSDGTLVNYGNVPIRVAFHTPPWMGGQPDFAGGVEECVHSYPKLGCDNWQQIFFNQWNDARCSIRLSGAVCKKRQSIQKI